MQTKPRPSAPKSLVAAAVICVVCTGSTARAEPLLDPLTLDKFVDPLPNPLANVISPVNSLDGMDLYEVSMTQFSQQLHSQLSPTTVWGYNGTYPGPTFEVQRGDPIKVNWVNDLVDGTGAPLPHLLPLDTTVHGAGPQYPEVRTVAHLHGGVVEPQSDGFPEHWFSADPVAPANGMGGPEGNSALYTYHNEQPSSTLWYHDHGMGVTRLNVYAGLAGFYLLRDDEEAALNLPSGDFEIPLVFQDRSFYADGQLFYPRGPGDLLEPGGADPLAGLPPEFPSSASVVPHFFGNTNLVNGKVWPVTDVEPRKYRFRMLNGSNSRFYDLQLDADTAGTLTFHQIGSDGGLLESPTERGQMLMAPGERADVIVDFSGLSAGDEVILRNFGPDGPFEGPSAGHTPADPNTTGQVMKFQVVAPTGQDTSSLPQTLVPVPRIPESQAVVTRQLSLVEELDEFGRPKLLLDGAKWTDPMTELPVKGTTEIWEITNSTTDSHPIHLHLVQFQALDRVSRQLGDIPLEPHELGWKDTIMVNRRETVRVIAKFEDFEGLYVWHCHILEHEDHEMMRAYEVVPGPELVVEEGVTLLLNDPLTTAAGNTLTVDGILNTPQLDVEGLLRGTGEVEANVVNRGTVSPGGDAIDSSLGTINQTGSYTQITTGTLAIEVAGNGELPGTNFDQLAVSGVANLDGTLDVDLIHPYVPVFGDAFTVLTAASVSGVFTSVDDSSATLGLSSAGLQLEWLSDYEHSGEFELLVGVLGDMDFNQDVDFDDIAPFVQGLNDPTGYLNTFGHGASAPGDLDGNFALDFDDIAHFVNLLGGGPITGDRQAVPEPSALCLATLSLLGLIAYGWRRRFARMSKLVVLLFAVVAMFVPDDAMGTQISLAPIQDSTLYEIEDGSLSNGAGDYLFAGRTAQDSDYLRRAVMAFDINANVPADSTIQSATLTLAMARTVVGAMTFDLHRLTSDWGEGTSNANGQEGKGKASTTNDATWIHTFYPGSLWTTPGGDFDATASGSTSVDGEGSYSWGSTAQMVADVQGWLDTPANNHGWILIGPEDVQSAKRFGSRENSDVALRPALVIEFVSGGPEIFNWIGTGSGGLFQDDANWDTGFAPSAPADVVNLINTESTDQIVTLSADITIDDLTIDGVTNSMLLSIERGQTANVGDLQIGALGGTDVELGKSSLGQVLASGTATLAGTLSLSTQGPRPSLTDTYEFMTYSSRSGAFDDVVVEEIQPGLSFSVHYDDTRALAIVGEWVAAGEELTGDFDVPQELLVSGAWDWTDTLIKRGAGELVLDLDGGFSAGSSAALAIVEGSVRLQGTGQTLSLDTLTFGELGQLSGDTSLAGEYGWYGNVVAVPEPGGLVLVAVGLLGLGLWRSRVRVRQCVNNGEVS